MDPITRVQMLELGIRSKKEHRKVEDNETQEEYTFKEILECEMEKESL